MQTMNDAFVLLETSPWRQQIRTPHHRKEVSDAQINKNVDPREHIKSFRAPGLGI
jgi:hypothetical protein